MELPSSDPTRKKGSGRPAGIVNFSKKEVAILQEIVGNELDTSIYGEDSYWEAASIKFNTLSHSKGISVTRNASSLKLKWKRLTTTVSSTTPPSTQSTTSNSPPISSTPPTRSTTTTTSNSTNSTHPPSNRRKNSNEEIDISSPLTTSHNDKASFSSVLQRNLPPPFLSHSHNRFAGLTEEFDDDEEENNTFSSSHINTNKLSNQYDVIQPQSIRKSSSSSSSSSYSNSNNLVVVNPHPPNNHHKTTANATTNHRSTASSSSSSMHKNCHKNTSNDDFDEIVVAQQTSHIITDDSNKKTNLASKKRQKQQVSETSITGDPEPSPLIPISPPLRPNVQNDDNEDTTHHSISPMKKILDVPITDFLKFLRTQGPTLVYQSKKVSSYTRKLFDETCIALSKDISNILLWRRLFSIVPIVFGTKDKDVLNNFLYLALGNKWDQITIETITPKKIAKSRSNNNKMFNSLKTSSAGSKKSKRANTFIRHGLLSKAMNEIARVEVELEDKSFSNTKTLLLNKHPDVIPGQKINESVQNEINSYKLPTEVTAIEEMMAEMSSTEYSFALDEPKLFEIIRKGKPLVSPGLDGFRNEHLKMLVGKNDRNRLDAQVSICEKLADIVTLICTDDERIPTEVKQALAATILIPIPKSSTDVRPIGMGMMLRKLASLHILSLVKESSMSTYLSEYQYALRAGGMEEVIHLFHAARTIKPHYDIYKVDANNAFNSANRSLGLLTILKEFPVALPLMRMMYNQPSKAFYFHSKPSSGFDEDNKVEILEILSKQGFHQGDVLGTWAYIMTLHPLLLSLHKHLAECKRNRAKEAKSNTIIEDDFDDLSLIDLLHLFFVDDGNLCGEHNTLLDAVTYLQQKGPAFGYFFNPEKGSYLIGECKTSRELQSRINNLNALGINASIVKSLSPPAAIFDIDTSDSEEENPLLATANTQIIEAEEKKLLYGTKMLGSYIGSDSFIVEQLRIQISKWKLIVDALISHTSLQDRMILLTKCFSCKPIHLLRSLPTHLTHQFAKDFTDLQKEVIASILGQPNISDVEMKTFCLPVHEGGLGILYCPDIQVVAYIASVATLHETSNLVSTRLQNHKALLEENIQPTPFSSNFVSNITSALDNISVKNTTTPTDANVLEEGAIEKFNIIKNLKSQSREHGTIQNQLYSNRVLTRKKFIVASITKIKRAVLNAISNNHAGSWLEALPKSSDMVIPDEKYRFSLRFRYLLPMHELKGMSKCRCQRNYSNTSAHIDEFAHHFVSGCPNHGMRLFLHNKGLATPILRCVKLADIEARNELTFRQLEALDDENASLPTEGDAINVDNTGIIDAVLSIEQGSRNKKTRSKKVKGPLDYKQQRPDIVLDRVHNGNINREIIELSITDTINGSKSGLLKLNFNQDTTVGTQCNKIYKFKTSKYVDKCRENGYDYNVIAMETSGLLHPNSLRWIETLSQLAAEKRKIPEKVMFKYMLKIISVSFQNALATLIMKRISLQKRGLTFGDLDINELQDHESDLIREHQVEYIS